MVADSAQVVVVALVFIGYVNAQALFARVVRARIAVVAFHLRSRDAHPVGTGIVHGARVSVAATGLDVFVHAADIRQASVCGTRVVVVAVQVPLGHACTAGAMIIQCALVKVVTFRVVWLVLAKAVEARIVGAHVLVIAVEERSGEALALEAVVVHCARVFVSARPVRVQVCAADIRQAEVVGALVVVVTIQRTGSNAHPVLATVHGGARVSIVTFGLVGH